MTAEEHLATASAAIEDHYAGDCVVHACAVAGVLHAEGREPWIGRLRQTIVDGESRIHAPLTPRRYAGRGAPTWTTHYVCGSGSEVFDPLIGAPIDAADFAEAAFGRPIAVEIFLDTAETVRAIAESRLVSAIGDAIRQARAHDAQLR
jgi:hypothetical protein